MGILSVIAVARTGPCSPLALKAAHRDEPEIVYGLPQGKLLRDNNNSAHSQTASNSVRCVIGQGAPVVRQENSFLSCRPFEQLRVRRFAQARLVSSQNIKVWDAAQQTAHNISVEVLVCKETQHRRL